MTGDEALIRLKRAVSGQSVGSSDFDLNPEFQPAKDRKLRPAAVLIALDLTGGQPRIYLTKRASTLKHHPGQIAFPGGKIDAADKGSAVTAALREAEEEIGLLRDNIEVLGTLPCHETVTSFEVTPVVGVVQAEFTPRAEPGEVEEVFTVPLEHILTPENFLVQGRMWRGTERKYFTVPYGPYYVWGATARMLRMLAELARP